MENVFQSLAIHIHQHKHATSPPFFSTGCRANYNVRVKLHRSLLLQEAAFFDTNETGYLLSRLNSDVNKIGQVISYHVNVVLRQFAQFVFGSIYLIKISPKLSMWAFAGIVLVAWLSAVYGDLARQLAEKVQDTFADATAVAETSFSMSETIRAFDGAEVESDKFEAAQSKALELEEVQAWAYGTHKFLSDTLQAILQVGLLVACWAVGKAGGLPASELTTFMFYTGFVLESSNEVGDQWAKIQQAVGASSSVFDLIQRVPAIRDPTDVVQDEKKMNTAVTSVVNGASAEFATSNGDDSAPNKEAPVIALKNVTLEYEAMERPALLGINANIYPGDRVALVGRSGSGKSSMLRTMLRFYDPSMGAIKLNGEDLRSLTRAETAAHVSLVEQEPHVFPMSLMDNVLYGMEKDKVDLQTGEARYSDMYRKKVSDCLRLAGIPVEPGNELGLHLDTRIGEGGRSLSGGQRQRVAIARAIIRSPQVLLLDEPTAALDSESERKVVESLRKAMEKTKSMVMVTHRLGIVRSLDVNRVIVLDRGEIVEEGHPEDLLRDEGSLYAALAREQGITKTSNDTQHLVGT
jgi:ABC-type multidrug transport system fused ATPase/permease subunit